MRQQTGLLKDETAHCYQVFDRGAKSLPAQPLPVSWIKKFRLVTEAEKSLLASCGSSGAGNAQQLIRRHRVRQRIIRTPDKRAIFAAIAA